MGHRAKAKEGEEKGRNVQTGDILEEVTGNNWPFMEFSGPGVWTEGDKVTFVPGTDKKGKPRAERLAKSRD